MKSDLFAKYGSIKKQIKILEQQIDLLQPEVIAELEEQTKDLREKSLKFDFGTFSVVERNYWSYTIKVIELEDNLNLAKQFEEENGLANAHIKKCIRYQG